MKKEQKKNYIKLLKYVAKHYRISYKDVKAYAKELKKLNPDAPFSEREWKLLSLAINVSFVRDFYRSLPKVDMPNLELPENNSLLSLDTLNSLK